VVLRTGAVLGARAVILCTGTYLTGQTIVGECIESSGPDGLHPANALTDSLRALGLQVIEGSANYLLFRAPETLGAALQQRGVCLRSCGNYPGLSAGWYRTAVRTAPENEQLLQTMREVLK